MPSDYTETVESFGTVYYKIYGEITKSQAIEKCQADGGRLPVPLDEDENTFFVDLIPDGQFYIWLGVNDNENEAVWVHDNGNSLTWSNWANWQAGTVHNAAVLSNFDTNWHNTPDPNSYTTICCHVIYNDG